MDDSCLTDDTVLDFVAGRLVDPARARVERHLGHCMLCNQLVAVAAGYQNAVPANDLGASAELPPGASARDTGDGRAPALPLGTVLRDTYRVVRLVGRGGMGDVFEAAHSRLPGRFAVKVLHPHCVADPKAIVRFRREAETTSELRHPNIVSIVDFDYTATGAPYLVMEYLEGGELARVIAEEAPLPLERVLRIVDEIASALAAVHRRGIVHRDLKPQNIFLVRADSLEHVKLCDFGISKVRAASVALTGERVLLGTPQYMAPEQARATEVDARADQFALAAIVYEMLTGRLAFPGDRLEIVVYRITNEDPLPLGAPWGPTLGPVLARALAKDPAARYASVEDFAAALRAAALARPVELTEVLARTTMRSAPADTAAPEPALAPTTMPPTTVSAGRARALAGGVAALAVIGVIVAAAVRAGAPHASPPPVTTAAPTTRTTIVTAPPVAPPPPPAAAPPIAPPEVVAPSPRARPTTGAPVRRKKTAAMPAPQSAPAPQTDQAPEPAPEGGKRGSLIDRL